MPTQLTLNLSIRDSMSRTNCRFGEYWTDTKFSRKDCDRPLLLSRQMAPVHFVQICRLSSDAQKIANFPTPVYFASPLKVFRLELGIGEWGQKKTRVMRLSGRTRSVTIPSAMWIQCTNVTDGQTDWHATTAKTALTHSVARVKSSEAICSEASRQTTVDKTATLDVHCSRNGNINCSCTVMSRVVLLRPVCSPFTRHLSFRSLTRPIPRWFTSCSITVTQPHTAASNIFLRHVRHVTSPTTCRCTLQRPHRTSLSGFFSSSFRNTGDRSERLRHDIPCGRV